MEKSVAEEISSVRFSPVRLREGYDIGEVDSFLDQLEAKARAGEPLDALVAGARFRAVRLREGYDVAEVDRFLRDVVRRSHGTPGPAPLAPARAEPPSVIQEMQGPLRRFFGRRAR